MVILSLALVFMIVFTCLAVQVILWQSNDISVSIVSESEKGNSEVTISVLNTAGATLLFYENPQVTGKIEYLSDEGWVEYCDISYTASNAAALSPQYGGMFAELKPGEDWDVVVPDETIAGMKNGTYRIKMTYITERDFVRYLDKAFNNRNEESEEISGDISDEVLDKSNMIGMYPLTGTDYEENDESIEEDFLAESICEVYVKTFEFTAPEDFVDEISIDDGDIEHGRFGRARITDETKKNS